MSPERKPPETYVIEWPGGPYDFELAPRSYGDGMREAEHRPGWYYLTGQCVKPEGVATTGAWRTLYAEKIGPNRFRMIPMQPG